MAAPGAPLRERMTGEDTFWWSLEGPHNPMVMLVLLRFGQRPRRQSLHALFASLVASHRRFRQRLVTLDDQVFWEDVARVPRSRHLLRVRLDAADGPSEDAQLQALMSRLAGTPLDAQRPLWQLIEVPLASGAALLVRVHHAIGDGMALLRLLLELSGRESAARSEAAHAGKDTSKDATQNATQDPAANPPETAVALAAHATPTPLNELAERLAAALRPTAPGQSPTAAVAALLAEAVNLSTIADESSTPLKGALSGQRRVACSRALPSAEVRRVARALDCSSHELLMACFSAALAGWLRARGLDPARIEWRAQVPVNLRSDADRTELGNGFGLLTLSLPLAPMNPAARAWELRGRLRELQRSRRGELTRLLFTAVGLLGEPTRQRAIELLSGKASAVLSCMPGPPRLRRLCGQTVDELMFWVPQGAGVGIGVSVLSYAEVFRVGVMCDQALLPDPDALLGAFTAEWDRLPALAEAMQALPPSRG